MEALIALQELVRREFEVARPVAGAWAGLAQVERSPEWASHIQAVTLRPSGGLTPQSAGASRLQGGLRSTFRMSEWDPPHHWTWVGPVLGMTVHYHHRVDPWEATARG
ncbi:MAG: SRPBCC family protein [Egibacteraceae bacterium]